MLLQRGTADATSGCVASGQARRDRLQMEAEEKGAALAAVRKREREALERAEEEESLPEGTSEARDRLGEASVRTSSQDS